MGRANAVPPGQTRQNWRRSGWAAAQRLGGVARWGRGTDPHVRLLPLFCEALCREQPRSCRTRRLKIKTMFPASLWLNRARVRGR